MQKVSKQFLPERDVRVFAIANSSVTFVHPTQGVETSSNISSPFCTVDLFAYFNGDCPRGTRVGEKKDSEIERCHVQVSHLVSLL